MAERDRFDGGIGDALGAVRRFFSIVITSFGIGLFGVILVRLAWVAGSTLEGTVTAALTATILCGGALTLEGRFGSARWIARTAAVGGVIGVLCSTAAMIAGEPFAPLSALAVWAAYFAVRIVLRAQSALHEISGTAARRMVHFVVHGGPRPEPGADVDQMIADAIRKRFGRG